MAALLANVNMFTLLSGAIRCFPPSRYSEGTVGVRRHIGSAVTNRGHNASDGFAWYSSMVNGVGDWLIPLLNQTGDAYGHSLGQVMVHVLTYVTFMTLGSMVFAKFWIETTNMGPKDVAKQIERTGMQIPGFRNNPQVVERILERYILSSNALLGSLRRSSSCWGRPPWNSRQRNGNRAPPCRRHNSQNIRADPEGSDGNAPGSARVLRRVMMLENQGMRAPLEVRAHTSR